MKAQYIQRTGSPRTSFTLAYYAGSCFMRTYHYHPELELVIVLQSTGRRFVGDSIERFEAGDIVLLGENLPHLWLNDSEYLRGEQDSKAVAYSVHFSPGFVESLPNLPETKAISRLFSRSRRGIRFSSQGFPSLVNQLERLSALSEFDRLVSMLGMLKELSEQSSYQLLSGPDCAYVSKKEGNDRLRRIYEYVAQNFSNSISLTHVAQLAQMNPSAFSRFFKKTQHQTFSRFLNEVRVEHACKLLAEQHHNVSEACYASGFNNISNFNRQFKSLKHMSPSQFARMHTAAD